MLFSLNAFQLTALGYAGMGVGFEHVPVGSGGGGYYGQGGGDGGGWGAAEGNTAPVYQVITYRSGPRRT